MIIRGGSEGGLDGIDIWGSNIHVHDVEVSNKDECMTIKLRSLSIHHHSKIDNNAPESSK